MSPNTYTTLTYILQGGSLIAVVLAVAFLARAIAGWRSPHRKRRLVRFAICLGALPILVITHQALLWGVFLPSQGREAERQNQDRVDAVSFVHVGDLAPSFMLTDANGGKFDLDAQRGKVVLVNFFATWCGPCLEELPHVQRLWDANSDNGDFALIVIGRDETNESVTTFQSKHGYSFPMASDPERTIYSLYAKELIPRSYLVSPDGKICFASTWSSDLGMSKLQSELDKQLRSSR